MKRILKGLYSIRDAADATRMTELKTILGLGSAAYTALTDYVTHALASAANDFVVASGAGAYVTKTLAETKAILGLVAGTTGTHTCKTIKKTIGNVGVTADLQMASANNKTVQNFDLGVCIPAKARLLDIFVYTDAAFTNLGALGTTVGVTSGDNSLIASADNTALDAILQRPVGATFTLTAITAADQHVWVGVTPANNWNSATPVGKMSVYVTYINVTGI
jgi:hypothetical protein